MTTKLGGQIARPQRFPLKLATSYDVTIRSGFQTDAILDPHLGFLIFPEPLKMPKVTKKQLRSIKEHENDSKM